MKKKVTAPLSYDPGKGRPKEHLAYLNWQEMQQLRRLNGDNMERGPRGLPSFPPADAKGSSSKASSSSKSSGGGGRDTGAKGNVGMGKAPSSGKASSGSYGGGGRDTGGRGNVGMGRAPSVAKAPSYGGGGRDTGRSRGIAVTPSLSRSLAVSPSLSRSVPSYGILDGRTIRNVLATPYNTVFPDQVPVTGKIQDTVGDLRSGGARLHSGYDFATKPGEPVYPRQPGRVIQVATSSGAYGPTVQVLAADGTIDRYALHMPQKISLKPGDPVYQDTMIGRAGVLDKTKHPGAKFSHLHYEAITRKDPAYNQIINEMNSGRLAKNKTGVFGSTTNRINGDKAKALSNPKTSTAEVMGRMGLKRGSVTVAKSTYPSTATQFAEAEKIKSPFIARPSPKPERIVPASAEVQPSGFSRMSPAAQLAIKGALAAGKVLGSPGDYKLPSIPQAGDFQKKILASLPPDARQKVVNQKLGEMATEFGQKLPSYLSAGMDTVRRGIAGLGAGRQTVQQASNESFVDGGEPSVAPSQAGMTDEQQKEFDKYKNRVQRTAQAGSIVAAPLGFGLGFGLRMAGSAINKAAEAKVNKYVASTPAERAEQERKDPSLIGWARAIGIQPQNDYSVYQVWAEKSGLRGPEETRGEDRAVQYAGGIGALPSATTPVGTSEQTGSRPYEYYQWDVGVNIPSPTDPNYTSYQEYLRRRAQAQA